METNFSKAVSQARAYIVLNDAAYASLLSQVIYTYNPDIEWGRTDGKIVELGSKWLEADLAVQAALIIHEILHVAFRHVPMAMKWVDPQHYDVWNILNDAIINTIIEGGGYLTLPPEGIKEHDVLKALSLEGPIEKWSSLELYREWLKKRDKASENLATYLKKAEANGTLDLVMEKLPFDGEVNSDIIQEQQLSEEIQAQLWKARIENYAKNSKGRLTRLAKFIPSSPYPWEKVVLNKASKACQGSFQRTYRAPSIIQKTLPKYPVILPTYRSQKKKTGVYIAVDVSGSVDSNMLNQMLGVADDIQHKLKTEVCLLFFDSSIQQVYLIKDSVKTSFEKGEIKITGGGGTNFQPIFDFIEQSPFVPPQILFVLTDGYGSFPSKPPEYSVCWVLTQAVDVPFGTKVPIQNQQSK